MHIFTWNESISIDEIDERMERFKATLYALYENKADEGYPDISEKTHNIAMDVTLTWEEK